MKSLFLIRYQMRRSPIVSRQVIYAADFAEAFARFEYRMGSQGCERNQYVLLDHVELPECETQFTVHRDFIRKLPDDQLYEFLQDRRARLLESGQPVERWITDYLKQLELVRS